MGGKPLKSELHHWWPQGLSSLWKDEQGNVSRLSWDRQLLPRPPKNFGAITNAHHIKLNGPWAGSVEPLFDDADSALPALANKLETLSHIAKDNEPFEQRLVPHQIDAKDRALLGEGLASLLVRCPAHRNLLHVTTERYRGRTGDQVGKPDDTLIALNINQHYRQVIASLERGGKIVLLRSGGNEFIMGEGYLSTLVGLTIQLQYHCLIPLTPTLAVLAFAPPRYRAEPAICTIGLTCEEVELVNKVTQIYSRSYIFFRRQMPDLIKEFTAREFRTVSHHSFEWLDSLMNAVAAFAPRRTTEL